MVKRTMASMKELDPNGGMILVDAEKRQIVAMSHAKELLNLRRAVSYLDRAQRCLVANIETDQKLILARFEAMVRQTRINQVSQET